MSKASNVTFPSRERYLLITGMYRSGTTYLQKLLNAHTDIAILNHGTRWYFSELDRQYNLHNNSDDSFRPLGIQHMTHDTHYRRLFEIELSDSNLQTMIAAAFDEVELDRRLGRPSHPTVRWPNVLQKNLRPDSGKEVFRQLFDAIIDYRALATPAHILGSKELHLEQFLPALVDAFGPCAKMIQLIRDPRSIIASRNYSSNFIRSRGGGTRHPVALITKLWKVALQNKYSLSSAFPDAFLSIRYEDLYPSPDTLLSDIVSFLGVGDQNEMLMPSRLIDEYGLPWKHNRSFVDPTEDAPDSSNHWRFMIPRLHLALIEYLCGREMELEGYPCVTSLNEQLVAVATYNEDHVTIPTWTEPWRASKGRRLWIQELAKAKMRALVS